MKWGSDVGQPSTVSTGGAKGVPEILFWVESRALFLVIISNDSRHLKHAKFATNIPKRADRKEQVNLTALGSVRRKFFVTTRRVLNLILHHLGLPAFAALRCGVVDSRYQMEPVQLLCVSCFLRAQELPAWDFDPELNDLQRKAVMHIVHFPSTLQAGVLHSTTSACFTAPPLCSEFQGTRYLQRSPLMLATDLSSVFSNRLQIINLSNATKKRAE